MPQFNSPNMFQTFDLGRAVTSGQRIQYNRMTNDALADEQIERKDMLRNRQKAQEIRSLYDSMPDQIAALERENMFKQADDLRNNYIQARKSEVTLLTSMRHAINADNYKEFRQELLQSGAVTPEMMPVEYSDQWFKKAIDKRKTSLTRFTVQSHRNGALMSRDYVQQDGEVNWELTGKWYDAGKDGKGGKGGTGKKGKFTFKAADANQIGEQIERMFGGFYDPQTGQLKGLDPTTAARVQSIQEEAELIYGQSQGEISHGVAVTRAARKLGINIENYRDKLATDPLSIRQ